DRELRADEHAPQAPRADAAGRRTSRRAQRLVDGAAGAVHGRDHPEEQRARAGERREQPQDRTIDPNLGRAWKISGAEVAEYADAEPRDRNPDRRRAEREQGAFG